MNKIYKLVLAIAMALSCVLTSVACAAEAPATDKALDEAVKYWSESFSQGFAHGVRMTSGNDVPLAKVQGQVEAFAKDELVPFLKRNGITDDWIKAQNDPEVKRLNAKTLQAKTLPEVQKLMAEGISYLKEKHPKVLLTDSRYESAFVRLVGKLQTIVLASNQH